MKDRLKNWKTTISGILLGVSVVAGVLRDNGVDLGHVGKGTVVTLVAGLATALLGMVAKDQ